MSPVFGRLSEGNLAVALPRKQGAARSALFWVCLQSRLRLGFRRIWIIAQVFRPLLACKRPDQNRTDCDAREDGGWTFCRHSSLPFGQFLGRDTAPQTVLARGFVTRRAEEAAHRVLQRFRLSAGPSSPVGRLWRPSSCHARAGPINRVMRYSVCPEGKCDDPVTGTSLFG